MPKTGISLSKTGNSILLNKLTPRTKIYLPKSRILPLLITQTPNKESFKDLLFIANRILVTLGAGYFHRVYRRAFKIELKQTGIPFTTVNRVFAEYRHCTLGEKEVHFFVLGDLLLSTVAVKALDSVALARFCSYIRHLNLKHGLIFNFNALRLDFRYFEL